MRGREEKVHYEKVAVEKHLENRINKVASRIPDSNKIVIIHLLSASGADHCGEIGEILHFFI